VGVHVPQAGDDRLAVDRNRRHAGRDRHRRARPDFGDPAVADEDDAVRDRRAAGAVDDRRAGHRIGAAPQHSERRRDRFQIGEAIARRPLHEPDQRRLEVLADRLEAEPAGAGDRGGQPAVLVQPHGLPPPHDAVDRVALEADDRRADADRLAPAGFDEDFVGRQAGHGPDHARLAMLLPVAQQQHLRRERRVAVDGVERRRQLHPRLGAVGLDDRLAPVDPHVGVDVDEAVAVAAGLERQRREVGLGPQRRGELHPAAAVGEVEVRRQRQIVPFGDDLIALVSNRLLDVMEPQDAALDRVRRREHRRGKGGGKNHSHGANHRTL
jgi:hypothetical protein